MSQFSESGDYRTVSALFDTEGEASRAFERLEEAGVPRSSIRLVPGYESGASVETRAEEHRGFFAALSDFFFPDEDRYTYAEGLSRGGYLVVVDNLPAGLHDQAVDILDDEGSIDLDERETAWRSEGWSGYSPEAIGSARTITEGDEETIPVVDEQLVVGKRDVNLGRVRVRSYVREEPVSTDVNLHEEHVAVERRAVDRPLTDADDAFRDRTIEAEEHAEEAVVGKEARVTEEISLRREGTEHTETVSDTVRKTEVEIDDERDVDVDRAGRR